MHCAPPLSDALAADTLTPRARSNVEVALTVSATDSSDASAWFSNYGSPVGSRIVALRH